MTNDDHSNTTRVTAPEEERSSFTGETPVAEDYAPRIRQGWNKSVEGMIETATSCAEAKKKLTNNELKALYARLPFDTSTFSKFAKIGGDDRLRDPQVKALLPSKYSIVYELSCLETGDLQALIGEGKITPGLKRADFKALLPPPKKGGGRKGRRAGGREGRTVLPAVPVQELTSVPSEELANWVRPVLRLLAQRGDKDLLSGDGDHVPPIDSLFGGVRHEGEAMPKPALSNHHPSRSPVAEIEPDEGGTATGVPPTEEPLAESRLPDGVIITPLTPAGRVCSVPEHSTDLRRTLDQLHSLIGRFSQDDEAELPLSRLHELITADGIRFLSEKSKDIAFGFYKLIFDYPSGRWYTSPHGRDGTSLSGQGVPHDLGRRILDAPVRINYDGNTLDV